jgi:hypothetical protein
VETTKALDDDQPHEAVAKSRNGEVFWKNIVHLNHAPMEEDAPLNIIVPRNLEMFGR